MDFTCPANVRFSCTRCGLCCGDTPQKTRHILTLTSEAEKIAEETCKPIADFTVEIKGKPPYSHEIKKTGDGKCVFLQENQCTVYENRPLICRFYPFQLTYNKDMETHVFDFTLECPAINQGKVLKRRDFEALFLLAQQTLP